MRKNFKSKEELDYNAALQWFQLNGFGRCPKFVEDVCKSLLKEKLGIKTIDRSDHDPVNDHTSHE